MQNFENEYFKKLCDAYEDNYKTKFEFKDSVARGSEIVFEWKGIEYGIFRSNDKKFLFGKQDNTVNGSYTFDELMNAEIDGEKLIDICTKITVIERTF